MKKLALLMLMASMVVVGCAKSNTDTSIQKTNPANSKMASSIPEDDSAKEEEKRNEAIAYITTHDSDIDTDFAAWLFKTYPDGTKELIDSPSYDKRLWYEKTGNSFHVLKTLYNGIENSPKTFFVEGSGDDKVTLAFAGDTSFAPDYAPAQLYINGGIDAAFSASLQESMKNADIFMLNNEFCYSDRGTPSPGKTYTFRADPASADWLLEMGVDIVTLANNHAFDYGEEAFLDTLATLESKNIPYTGGGYDIEDAKTPTYLVANGIKIGFVAATEIEASMAAPHSRSATEDACGLFRTENLDMVCDSIREAKENSDFVVVFPHWGKEREHERQYDQQFLAYAFVEAGADTVIGSHPHVLQGVENYNNVPIFYSLGNYFFNTKTPETCLLYLDIDIDGIVSAKYIPCVENGNGTVQCEPDDSNYTKIIKMLNDYSLDNVIIDEDGVVNY